MLHLNTRAELEAATTANVTLLLASGFCEYQNPCKRRDYNNRDFQLKVSDDVGIKYFINVNVWEIDYPNNKISGMTVEMQFQSVPNLPTINVEFSFEHGESVETLKNHADLIFNRLGAHYYE